MSQIWEKYIYFIVCSWSKPHSVNNVVFFKLTGTPKASEVTHLESVVHFCTPEKASVEFGILLFEILEELEKNETKNLRRLKAISSSLTIQNNSKVHVFNDTQLKEIQACNKINIYSLSNI